MWYLSPDAADILRRRIFNAPDALICTLSLESLPMVRLRIHEIMKTRRITAYALSKGTSLSYPTAYRLSRASGEFGRLHTDTLDALCRFFHLQPGKLLHWVP